MRVISGERRGKKLITLEGLEVRPTSDRVKEAVFDILQFSVEGCRFLDLFAGSGQVGIEAISRGASQAVMVDASREALKVVEKNLTATGFGPRAQVRQGDALAFLRSCRDSFDIAFLDPPYRSGLLDQALPLTAACMAPDGVILCEHPWEETLPETAGEFARKKVYRYGKIALSLYRRASGEEEAL